MQREAFTKLPINKVTPNHIAEYRDRRLGTVGNQVVRHDLNLLGHMYKIAINEWSINTANPLDKVTKPQQPEARSRRLSDVEKGKLLASLNAYLNGGSEFQWFVRWQLATAMRKSESLGLTWRDIDMERSFAFLAVTKNGRSRNVPLSPKAKDILQQLRINAFKPFENLSVRSVDYHWKQMLKLAGIPDFHIHDLRRECITTLLEKGLSIPEVAAISGHSSWEMVQRYNVTDEQKVVSKLAAMID